MNLVFFRLLGNNKDMGLIPVEKADADSVYKFDEEVKERIQYAIKWWGYKGTVESFQAVNGEMYVNHSIKKLKLRLVEDYKLSSEVFKEVETPY